MKEKEPKQPSIWEKLTPQDALNWAEKILCRIEDGELRKEIYEPIADRLIAWACKKDNSSTPESSKEKQYTPPTHSPQKQPCTVNNNRIRHSLGLEQLPSLERVLYKRRRAVLRSIYKTNKNGKSKEKNRRKQKKRKNKERIN